MTPADAQASPLRIVVVDDNPVVRAGLRVLLTGRPDIEVVAEAADGAEAVTLAAEHRPDVVLLDVRMPGLDGISALPHLVPLAPVVMLTYSREEELVLQAVGLGASGYLVHGEFTADQLVAAVRDIRRGRAHVTTTAATALLARMRGEGGTLSDFAERLGSLPVQTVNSQLQPSVDAPDRRARFRLSHREREVMELIADGMSNQQIAATCFISEKTVKNHINRIFTKLHVSSRAEAVAVWLGRGRQGSAGGTGPVSHG